MRAGNIAVLEHLVGDLALAAVLVFVVLERLYEFVCAVDGDVVVDAMLLDCVAANDLVHAHDTGADRVLGRVCASSIQGRCQILLGLFRADQR